MCFAFFVFLLPCSYRGRLNPLISFEEVQILETPAIHLIN